MNILRDSFGRTFPYIRMSITDVCNFKCGYCLPNGYQVDKSDNRKFLHLDEIKRLAKGFSELGVSKIRITGGEPTVRKDFFEIIKFLKNEARITGRKFSPSQEKYIEDQFRQVKLVFEQIEKYGKHEQGIKKATSAKVFDLKGKSSCAGFWISSVVF